MDYEAWVRFWLCERALRSGGASCSSRDVRSCFRQLDEAGRERVGPSEVASFYKNAVSDPGRPRRSIRACKKTVLVEMFV